MTFKSLTSACACAFLVAAAVPTDLNSQAPQADQREFSRAINCFNQSVGVVRTIMRQENPNAVPHEFYNKPIIFRASMAGRNLRLEALDLEGLSTLTVRRRDLTLSQTRSNSPSRDMVLNFQALHFTQCMGAHITIGSDSSVRSYVRANNTDTVRVSINF